MSQKIFYQLHQDNYYMGYNLLGHLVTFDFHLERVLFEMVLLQLDLLDIVMFDIAIHDIGIGHLLHVR